MKKLITLAALIGFTLTASAQLAPKQVTLAWDAIPGAAANPDWKVRIYTSTNSITPMVLWDFLGETAATNTTFTLTIMPGTHFFVVTAKSTFWNLESGFSNVASTPPVPAASTNLLIRLGL